jgi:hypothetical protein
MRCLWTVALAGLTAALLLQGAPAGAGEAMRFRLAADGRTLSAIGEIRADTPGQFRKLLAGFKGRKPAIVITSPGGRLSAALALGRLIRKQGLDVTARGTCTSACPFVLAGGVKRHAEQDAVIGVHQALMIRSGAEANGSGAHLLKDTQATARQFRLLRSRLRSYLGEMGVSPALVSEMDKATPFGMNVLSTERLQELRLVTLEPATSPVADLLTSSMEPLP